MAFHDILSWREAALLLALKFYKHDVEGIDPHHLLGDVTREDAIERRGYWMPKSYVTGGKVWFRKSDVEELAQLVVDRRIKSKSRKSKPSWRPTLAELIFTEQPGLFADRIPAIMKS